MIVSPQPGGNMRGSSDSIMTIQWNFTLREWVG
jgi:hypothetical protein